jgi:hypothetical protein
MAESPSLEYIYGVQCWRGKVEFGILTYNVIYGAIASRNEG